MTLSLHSNATDASRPAHRESTTYSVQPSRPHPLEVAHPRDHPDVEYPWASRCHREPEPGEGANEAKDDRWDDVRHDHSDLFILDDTTAELDGTTGNAVDPPRTTFCIHDQVNPPQDPTRWRRRKRLHHDVGADYSDSNRKRDIFRRDARYRRLDAILQSIEIPVRVRQWALDRAFTEEVMGFNGHYNGYYGAVLGFALLELFDDVDDALGSVWVDRMADVVDELPDEEVDLDVEALAGYAFRRGEDD